MLDLTILVTGRRARIGRAFMLERTPRVDLSERAWAAADRWDRAYWLAAAREGLPSAVAVIVAASSSCCLTAEAS